VGELTPVTLSSHGVGKLVSVLVSVADSLAPNSLLHTQLEMEARVGIGPWTKHPISNIQHPTSNLNAPTGGDVPNPKAPVTFTTSPASVDYSLRLRAARGQKYHRAGLGWREKRRVES
jgi:hypothetical protein